MPFPGTKVVSGTTVSDCDLLTYTGGRNPQVGVSRIQVAPHSQGTSGLAGTVNNQSKFISTCHLQDTSQRF